MTDSEKLWAANLKAVWKARKSELGLNQERAADIFGCTQSGISQYLNGRIPLNTDAIYKFAKMLDVPPHTINPKINELIPVIDPLTINSPLDLLPIVERMPAREAAKFLGMVEAIVDKKLKED